MLKSRSKDGGATNYLLLALEERLAKQDKRLAEVAANYDILNAKVEALISNRRSNRVQKENLDNIQPLTIDISTKTDHDSVRRVLKALLDRDMTALEVMGILGCTREHAARLMKQLTEKGLVLRINDKKPFVYRINEKGKNFVGSN